MYEDYKIRTVTHFKKDGTMDLQAEFDDYIAYETPIVKFTVLKSAIRGNVYYAAVELNYFNVSTQKSEITVMPYFIHFISKEQETVTIKLRNYILKELDSRFMRCPMGIIKLLTVNKNNLYLQRFIDGCTEYHLREQRKLKDM